MNNDNNKKKKKSNNNNNNDTSNIDNDNTNRAVLYRPLRLADPYDNATSPVTMSRRDTSCIKCI